MAQNLPQSTKEEITATVGDVSSFIVMNNQLLVGIYMRSEKVGNIFLPDATRDEDRWQGKVGVVLKKGPTAFVSDGNVDFHGQDVNVGDWVLYRTSDGFPVDVNKAHCRLLEDIHIKAVISDPSMIY